MRLNDPKWNKILKILCFSLSLCLTLLWLGFIFSNSLKSGSESGEQSSKVHEAVNQVASSLGVKEEISEDTVRKGAHFTEFGLLGFLICLCIASARALLGAKGSYRLMGLCAFSIPVCAILAAVDEYLQTFSEGRTAEVADALLDTAGATVGTAFFLAILWFILIIRKERN